MGHLLLRGFKLGASGDDNTGMALGVSIAAGPFAMFIQGREIVIPAGTRGIARSKAPPSVAAEASPAPALEAAPANEASTEPAPSPPENPVSPKE